MSMAAEPRRRTKNLSSIVPMDLSVTAVVVGLIASAIDVD